MGWPPNSLRRAIGQLMASFQSGLSAVQEAKNMSKTVSKIYNAELRVKASRYDEQRLALECVFIVLFVKIHPEHFSHSIRLASTRDLFERYPEFSSSAIMPDEIAALIRFTNWMQVVLGVTGANSQKKHAIWLSMLISEGKTCSFGGGIGASIRRRVEVYRREGGVPLDEVRAERTSIQKRKPRPCAQLSPIVTQEDELLFYEDLAIILDDNSSGTCSLGESSCELLPNPREKRRWRESDSSFSSTDPTFKRQVVSSSLSQCLVGQGQGQDLVGSDLCGSLLRSLSCDDDPLLDLSSLSPFDSSLSLSWQPLFSFSSTSCETSPC